VARANKSIKNSGSSHIIIITATKVLLLLVA